MKCLSEVNRDIRKELHVDGIWIMVRKDLNWDDDFTLYLDASIGIYIYLTPHAWTPAEKKPTKPPFQLVRGEWTHRLNMQVLPFLLF